MQPRDRVMICAENRPEWAIADLAIMAIGAIVVPAYTTNTEDDHIYIMEHSGAVVIITSGGILGNRVALAASRVPNIRMLITMDPGKDEKKNPNYKNEEVLATTSKLMMCPSCESRSVVNEGGCLTCQSCGWSKCD